MTSTPWRVLLALFGTLALLGAACGDDDDTTAAAEDDDGGISIEDPWARATADGQTVGAVYLQITSATDDAVVGASVAEDVAATVELHETVMAGDTGDDMDDVDDGMDDTGGDELQGDDMEGDDMELGPGEDGMEMEDGSMDDGMETGDDHGDHGGGAMTMQEVSQIDLPAGETVALEPGGLHIMLLDLAGPLVAGETFDVTIEFAGGTSETVAVEIRES